MPQKNQKKKESPPITPPKWADRLLKWYCKEEELEILRGDVYELFEERVEQVGEKKARWYFYWDVIALFRPFAWKKFRLPSFIYPPIMFRNSLKITLRTMSQQKGFTLLNILGLSFGMIACLLIFLYVDYELGYDRFYSNKDRIFRASAELHNQEEIYYTANTQPALGPTAKEEFAEVQEYTRIVPTRNTNITYEERQFEEKNFLYADSTLLALFDFPFVKGNPNTALDEPNSIILTEQLAKKYFGEEDPIDKILTLDRELTLKVTGVFEDIPDQSHLQANAFISLHSQTDFPNENWGGFYIHTYFLLSSESQASPLEAKLQQIVDTHVDPLFEERGMSVIYKLLASPDIHLHSNYSGELQPKGNMDYVYLFATIGLFMLIIASINFINLSTARSSKRSIEVGIRKVLGSTRSQLITHFLIESLVITILALFISLATVWYVIPVINNVLDLQLRTDMLMTPSFFVAIGSIVFLVGILGGSYPAFFLAKIKPVSALKRKTAKGPRRFSLRSILIIVQFTISLFLLIGTGIIYEQLQYVKNKSLGINEDQVVTFSLTTQEQRDKWNVLQAALQSQPNILSAATAYPTPGSGYFGNGMYIESDEGIMIERNLNGYYADFDYVETIGIEVVQGRNFSSDFSTDSTQAILVNESMVRTMGWKDPIGKRVRDNYIPLENEEEPYFRVVGVIKDYHHESLYGAIPSLIIFPDFHNRTGLIKIETASLSQSLDQLTAAWNSIFPATPLEYQFLDETFFEQYHEDEKRGLIFLIFSGITIFIACLGLLGLASYTSILRAKEISIRRVLGAKISQIIQLMTKEYLALVVIASIPAFALSWYLMNKWLESFTYRIEIDYFLFLGAFLLVSILSLCTTGYFALKTAQLNPAETLKDE